MARYTLYEQGPDDNSTYSACWGSMSRSHGRNIASGPNLVALMDAVDKIGHDNWAIYGPGDRFICGSRSRYYSLPTVARELARLAQSV